MEFKELQKDLAKEAEGHIFGDDDSKKELLTYLTEGAYEKDFDSTKSAMFMQIMAEREEIQRERIREDFYKYMKYQLPELFEVLEKTPERFVIEPKFEDGVLFNIKVKDESND